MNQLDKQTEFLRITIEHEYFDGIIPIDLYPADVSIEKKYGIRIRRAGNSWVFYGRELQKEDFLNEFKTLNLKCNSIVEKPAETRMRKKEELNEEKQQNSVVFNLIIKPKTALFHYVTSVIKDHSGTKIDIFNKQGIQITLEDTTLKLLASSKYFEYIFFTKNKQLNLKVVEANGLIDFYQVPIDHSGDEKQQREKEMIQFISKNQISLSHRYNYQINLIENTKYGDRIILNAIKIPEPTSISKEKPYKAITAYYTV